MSRPWTRFGIRALALALLLTGVGGGYYLSQYRDDQRQGISAQLAADATQEEIGFLKERQREYTIATAQQREAQRLAAEKAEAAAKAEAERVSKAEDEASRRKREKEAAAKPYTGPIPTSCKQYSGNRQIGCAMMIDAGFPIAEFPCLEKLWTKESGWNHKARNSSSGAYGIAQAYPGSKMASAGSDWQTNPATQIKWGLGYVKGRYKTPCGAWTYFQNNGSY